MIMIAEVLPRGADQRAHGALLIGERSPSSGLQSHQDFSRTTIDARSRVRSSRE